MPTVPRHGAAVRQGGFGHMFPDTEACEVSDEAIDAIVEWMGADGNATLPNSRIPAGFTYLGQFIDHDITFDPTPLSGRGPPHPVNLRTPALDLDSVYGAGPMAQPYLYDRDSEPEGVRLLVGHNRREGTDDLPRNDQARALIGDARNDEHVIVSQLHLLFIRFHNAVVDHLAADGIPPSELFERARELVRRHYQWIVLHKFLPKVLGSLPVATREFFRFERKPFIPYEFSAAAYRFGHSMVRPEYGVRREPEKKVGVHPFTIFPGLEGFKRLPKHLVIDWERFFELPGEQSQVQFSMRIDTSIAKPLFDLPDGEAELPRRTLLRGRKLSLPSGQTIAEAMHAKALTDAQLQLDKLRPGVRDELRAATPLWFYVLCEAAAAGGKHLGPVGGRIVSEVLTGLIEGDPTSYVNREPTWTPRELGTGGDFTMGDLVKVAVAGLQPP